MDQKKILLHFMSKSVLPIFSSKNVHFSICLCHLQFFHRCLIVFGFQVFRLLGFIPRWFLLFDEMVNGICSLISLSHLSLLVYENAPYFCALILYPATSLNSLRSSNFLAASLGFSMHKIMSFANSDSFISILVWISFLFLLCHG